MCKEENDFKSTLTQIELNTPEQVYQAVLDGRLKRFPNGFWNTYGAEQRAARCLRYLYENILHLKDLEIPEVTTVELLYKYKLKGLLVRVFKGNLFNAMENAYPGVYKPYMFPTVGSDYWSDETCAEAVRWLILDKLKLSKEEVKEQFSCKLLVKHSMRSLVMRYSVFQILELAFPGEYKPWELNKLSKHFCIDDEKVEEMTRYYIEHFDFRPGTITPSDWAAKIDRSVLRKQYTSKEYYELTCKIYSEMQKEASEKSSKKSEDN